VDEDGSEDTVTLPERNLLLGGEPGAGKSNVLQLLVAVGALDPLVRLTLFDPELVELASRPLGSTATPSCIENSMAPPDADSLVRMGNRTPAWDELQAALVVEPRSPTAPRVEGSGRTVLACPTPSRKRPTNQLGTRAGHRPAVLIHGRLRWLHRLPPAVSWHATVSTVPRFQGQGRPPGQAIQEGRTMTEPSVSFAGNLTDDPELRHTESGIARAVCRVAVSARREQEASFFTVIVWRDQAEHAAQSLAKGSRIVVVGRLQQRSWTAEDGSARSVVEVVAEELGASLRWATSTTTRATRSSNQ
jgi:single-strand DNA-binding protein